VKTGKLQLRLGVTFAVCQSNDPDDQELVTIKEINGIHVLLDGRSEISGWRPIDFVQSAIDEANVQLCLHKQP
jgi:hypothetical protein